MDPCKTAVCGAARIGSVAYFWKGAWPRNVYGAGAGTL
jgi:hypothetical protein